jgi:single-strand DNA-binding protein
MAEYMKVILLGNLTREPDYRHTPSGMAVCEFGVAVNSGRQGDKPYFGQVVTFGKTADACRQYLSKGSQVFVEGKLQNDEWEDKNGQKRSKTRIVADTVQFIGRSDNARQNAQSGQYSGYSGYSAPAPQPQQGFRGGVDPQYAPPPPPLPEAPAPDPDIPF